MKKFLIPLLCAIPLIAKAENIGGFNFNPTNILENTSKFTVLAFTDSHDVKWLGDYNGSTFRLYTKAKGKDKVWFLNSAKKGTVLKNDKNGKVCSQLYLVQLDCAEGRSKLLTARTYSGYFQAGKLINHIDPKIMSEISDWDYEPNDSDLMAFGCYILEQDKKAKW